MEFRLLGPVEVATKETVSGALEPKPRTLLALLMCNAGVSVSVGDITMSVWGEWAPASRQSVYVCVSQLRRMLGQVAGDAHIARQMLLRSAGGYALDVDRTAVDLFVVEDIVARGRSFARSGELEASVAAFSEALSLWRGTALGGTQGDWAAGKRTSLENFRLTVLEERIESQLAMGRSHELLDELTALVDGAPLRERLRGQLMIALGQVGRRVEALDRYHDGRRLLGRSGVGPGAALRAVYQRLLEMDPTASG
ncbi:AfsR/SARP family transcriptional regulator [Pseudonocardia sp. TRM90224]|uniref:AfsR/SARP family transcriptional regulator n=1 Tax=Pseudonocardia sp. TRM90224 TaxID=2812678 RepID=UPI001E616370|nr:BTAD domain-containing putative transcriptional regulator [Pseudonocardia sp. TRM90224]